MEIIKNERQNNKYSESKNNQTVAVYCYLLDIYLLPCLPFQDTYAHKRQYEVPPIPLSSIFFYSGIHV